MKAKCRVWYHNMKLELDEQGFTPAFLVGEHGKIVEQISTQHNMWVTVRYMVWEKWSRKKLQLWKHYLFQNVRMTVIWFTVKIVYILKNGVIRVQRYMRSGVKMNRGNRHICKTCIYCHHEIYVYKSVSYQMHKKLCPSCGKPGYKKVEPPLGVK